MSARLTVLGSGSSGNCSVLSFETDGRRRHLLIDAGFSPKRTGQMLAPLGLSRDDITDILVTHFDQDHFRPTWSNQPVTVHAHRRHRSGAMRAGVPSESLNLVDDVFTLADDIVIDPILLAHDRLGSVGYVVEHAGVRVGWATDLGRVTPGLIDHFDGLDVLAIESNYDRSMQMVSHRPEMLKRRIMGGAGHLSNEQTLDAVLRIARRSELAHIILLHLSRQCNSAGLVTSLYTDRAPHLLRRLTVSSQYRATPTLTIHASSGEQVGIRRGEQMTMFG